MANQSYSRVITHLIISSINIKLHYPLVTELNKALVNGMNIDVDGMEMNCNVKQKYVRGDNLGLHEIAGLPVNFNNGFICRWCYATYDEIQTLFDSNNFCQRTNHNWETLLPYFDISQSLPPDIMHDLYEGVIPKTLSSILPRILTERNYELFRVEYNKLKLKNGYLKLPESIHALLTTERKIWIKGKASKEYKIYLTLRSIDAIINSENSDVEARMKLKDLTTKLLRKITGTLQMSVYPKLHYLSHYPDLIETFGPLWKFSTLRFERKHLYFKQLAEKLKNSKNITMSLSERHLRLRMLSMLLYIRRSV
ncbi:uncharacterized protein B4U80_10428 [Leptotrombidium deliense]|uniref:Uncharacterized protein n=1 Tax=Leptotrombidium deliense TaxID=299467 RepID=A0A443S0N1_9ACAR|nr:uncharacterized protein B4U80_10428 [Leptotrombidium deliense]